MYVCLPICMYVTTCVSGALEVQELESGSMELEVHLVVRLHVNAESQTQVLCKSINGSETLSSTAPASCLLHGKGRFILCVIMPECVGVPTGSRKG